MSDQEYDVIVIGAGPTGENVAERAVPGGWLYAVGDVNHRNLLTHMGKYQARACGDAIVARAHAATIAVVGEVPLRRLWHAVPSFPTISEVWLRFLQAYGL